MRPRILDFKNHSRSCHPSRLWQAPLARRSAKDARDSFALKAFRAEHSETTRILQFGDFSEWPVSCPISARSLWSLSPMIPGGRVVVRFQRSHQIQKLVAKPAARGFDTACGACGFARLAIRANGEVRGLPGPPRPAAFLCGFCCMVRGKISSP
jgi:hypothetical protein